MNGDGVCPGRACAEAAPEPVSADQVAWAVAEWVDQVGRFLGVLQAAVEQSSPRDDATAEVRAVSGQLPAMIRQCRAQVPTPEMIRIWVKSVSEESASHPVAADA